jgi:hypothetical protein
MAAEDISDRVHMLLRRVVGMFEGDMVSIYPLGGEPEWGLCRLDVGYLQGLGRKRGAGQSGEGSASKGTKKQRG